MAPKKKVTGLIKLQIPAGAANPAPPVGPALGAAGVNIMQFCQAFNAATKDKSGDIIPVEITVYEDKSFDFVTKTPPAAKLIVIGFGMPTHTTPDGITIATPTQTEIVVTGADKQLVGEVAAKIRGYRPPEPYKGKGVKYSDETIIRKEAKKA